MKILPLLLLALATLRAAPAADSIHLGGSALTPSDWTVAQLKQALAGEIKPVEYASHGAKHTFDCVPLVSVLKAAGGATDFVMKGGDPKVKNPQLRLAVIVRGRDGYTVLFSLAEILPSVGGRVVWVALDEDGQPLAEAEGPVRLIVPDDKMPARGVHEIASIELTDPTVPATQPANP